MNKTLLNPVRPPGATTLRKSNSKIVLAGKQAVKALQDVEFMMISLRNIEDHYFYKEIDFPGQDPAVRDEEISRFISENNFIKRLCLIRKIISKPFDSSLGKDDMDDLERAMEHLVFWEKPGD